MQDGDWLRVAFDDDFSSRLYAQKNGTNIPDHISLTDVFDLSFHTSMIDGCYFSSASELRRDTVLLWAGTIPLAGSRGYDGLAPRRQ